jgi:uncharacterized protein (TIGR00369 family)
MDEDARAAIVRMVPFSAHLGFELVRCDAACVVVEVMLKPEHCTTFATAHGGFLMALADFAGAAGAHMSLPDGAKASTTLESKTNMIGAAPAGTRLRATSTPVHVGKRTSIWQTRVETAEGKLISLTTQTQMAL